MFWLRTRKEVRQKQTGFKLSRGAFRSALGLLTYCVLNMTSKTYLNTLLEAANIIENETGTYLQLQSSDGNSNARVQEDNFWQLEFETDHTEPKTFSKANHNILERNRRAQLRKCFVKLQELLPNSRGQQKCSNASILKEAIDVIKALKDRDQSYKTEKAKLLSCKEWLQTKLSSLQQGKDPGQISLHDFMAQNLKTNLGSETLTPNVARSAPVTSRGGYMVTENIKTAEVGVNTDFPDDFIVTENAKITLIRRDSTEYPVDILE